MSDIVLHDKFQQKQGDKHSHTRQDKKTELVVKRAPDVAIKNITYEFYSEIKNDSGAPREHADYKTQKQYLVLIGYFKIQPIHRNPQDHHQNRTGKYCRPES